MLVNSLGIPRRPEVFSLTWPLPPVVTARAAPTGMSEAVQFLVVLSIVILLAKAAGYLSIRLGQPAVLGELLAGVLLGPSMLNIVGQDFITAKAPLEATIKSLSELGVIFLMFMAGLETNLAEMFRVGKVAVFSGVSGVILPVGLGVLVCLPFGYDLIQAMFIGIALAATSVSISAQTLLELGVLRRKEGTALLGAAVLDDVLVVLVLSLFLALVINRGEGGGAEVLLVLARMIFYFVAIILLGIKILPWLLRKIEKLPISEGLTAATIVIVLLAAATAEFVGGVAMIVGAFVAGVLVGRTDYKASLQHKFQVLIYSFLVPVFLVNIGLRLDIRTVQAREWLFTLAVCAVAIISKIAGCGLGARLAGFNNLSSLRLGLGMVSRGEVGLIVGAVGIGQGIIGNQVYVAVVVMVLVTTLFTPLALKLAFRGVATATTSEEAAYQGLSLEQAAEMAAATGSEQELN